jgi:hypothetical protein
MAKAAYFGAAVSQFTSSQMSSFSFKDGSVSARYPDGTTELIVAPRSEVKVNGKEVRVNGK